MIHEVSITKILRFEAAHVIHGHSGGCGRIHGHSYELHVTVALAKPLSGYIDGLGMVFDFKELKKLMNDNVIGLLDHRLLVSKRYLEVSGLSFSEDEILALDAEPTAENLLIFINEKMTGLLPVQIRLSILRLWETRDSYAEMRLGD
jgi:6-pyruvoyltetrahydropterin/6-carboxytetrahydropterin synthase